MKKHIWNDQKGSEPVPAVPVVTDNEIMNPDFVRAVRNHLASLNVPATGMLNYLADIYRDLDTDIVDGLGLPVFLDFGPLESDPDEKDIVSKCPVEETIRDWFRTMTTPVPDNTVPRVRRVAWERFRVVATLTVASNPDKTWPRSIAANDNMHSANDNCP